MTLANRVHILPREIAEQAEIIAEYARREGLDFFETIFEHVDYDQITQIAAYGGFPQRYPHWRFGMDYEKLRKQQVYGLSKIYEMVINNDPCYAYLLSENTMTDHKLVIAHVYGHCDFFKNNTWFSKTNRKMMDDMANHATRVRRYIERHGYEAVERFIDTCLSIEDLIDPHSVFMRREPDQRKSPSAPEVDTELRFKAKAYMEPFINPRQRSVEATAEQRAEASGHDVIPRRPHRDVLGFLMMNAPLADWQIDILSIIREEAYYFAPQGQTKIMNEGWASYWHSTLMTRYILGDDEVVTYCDHHSGTVATQPGRLNPYKVGLELLRDIEHRWNTGRYGSDYENCNDMEALRNWGRDGKSYERTVGLDSPGREKIYEVRKVHNDVTFIDEFLTPEFVDRHKMYHYRQDPTTGRMVVVSRDFNRIKQQMLYMLTNHCRPYIYVCDGNYGNRGELYLAHRHNGLDLEIKYVTETLRSMHKLWTRPVHLLAQIDDDPILFSFDGDQSHQQRVTDKDLPEPAHRI